MKLSTYITVIGVSIIIIAKLFGWLISDSVTMLASLVDSLLDVAVSIMNLLTIRYALQPPDHEHRFGHGKAEDLAVFCQSVFFGSSGLFLIFTAVSRIFSSTTHLVKANNTAAFILVFSIVVTLVIISFQRLVLHRVKSNVIEADSLHYIADFLTNITAIAGIMFAGYLNSSFFDSIAAITIAAYIIYTATKMF